MHARWSKALKSAYLVLLFGFLYIPIAVLIVFKYIPMYGAQIAFRDL